MPPASPTPSHTLLLLSLPPSILCGIDLQTFTLPATRTFHGLKNIPPGLHFFFTSETTSLSLRSGFWFRIPPRTSTPTLMVRRWERETSSLVAVEGAVEEYWGMVGEVWENGLSPYRQPADNETGSQMVARVSEREKMNEGDRWRELTGHITPGLLTQLLQGEMWEISSSSSILQDRDEIPGLTPEDTGLEERELTGLKIDLKRTWREGATGRERTDGARDWSWALEDVVERGREMEDGEWGGVVLGQMEACFLMVLTVGNYSCLEEWKRCAGLVLGCKRAVAERQRFFEEFLAVLARQIERFEDVDGGLFDMSDEGGGLLKGWLRTFHRTLGQAFQEREGADVKAQMEELKLVLKKMYEWNLDDGFVRKGMVQLEDGEMIELEIGDTHGEDEDEDYAPVIVDTVGI